MGGRLGLVDLGDIQRRNNRAKDKVLALSMAQGDSIARSGGLGVPIFSTRTLKEKEKVPL